jgi:hypothetical protein
MGGKTTASYILKVDTKRLADLLLPSSFQTPIQCLTAPRDILFPTITQSLATYTPTWSLSLPTDRMFVDLLDDASLRPSSNPWLAKDKPMKRSRLKAPLPRFVSAERRIRR